MAVDTVAVTNQIDAPIRRALVDELRASHPQMAVVMLTARGAEEDRVRGLKVFPSATVKSILPKPRPPQPDRGIVQGCPESVPGQVDALPRRD